MYCIGKKIRIACGSGRWFSMLLMFTGIVVCIAACSKDSEELRQDLPPKKNPPVDGSQGGGQDTIVPPSGSTDADKVSEYLRLEGASKINGSMPTATGGPLQINYQDSIFLATNLPDAMKDLKVGGARIMVKHDGLYHITGFFVGVPNSSFYYDMPVISEQAGDSTDVIYIDTNFPVADFEEGLPYSFPLVIIPHENGVPIKEFLRTLTVEDANSNGVPTCPFTSPAGADPTPFRWKWEMTAVFLYDGGEVREFPGEPNILKYKSGGCCQPDGSSTLVGNIDSDTGDCYALLPPVYPDSIRTIPNPKWRNIDVEHYFQWNFDVLEFYDDGTFYHENESEQTNYRPSLSNFCTGEAAYDFQEDPS